MKRHYTVFPYAVILLTVCFLSGLTGCRSKPAVQEVTPTAPLKVVLAPGDQIEIKFAYAEQFNELQTIRPDGKIELQFVGEVAAEGKTPAELRAELTQLFTAHLQHPQLAVMVRTFVDNRVYVGGEVMQPGLIAMPGRMTALEAIMNAGGMKMETAGTKNIIVLRQVEGKYQGYPLNLNQTLAGNTSVAAFQLQPRDILFVPQSTIVKVNKWVEQHINKIVPDIGWNISRTSPSGRTNWGYSTSNN
ncbi:MAG: polysaccharide biosynthesis/export family protein [Pseudomonadota bacterium]